MSDVQLILPGVVISLSHDNGLDIQVKIDGNIHRISAPLTSDACSKLMAFCHVELISEMGELQDELFKMKDELMALRPKKEIAEVIPLRRT